MRSYLKLFSYPEMTRLVTATAVTRIEAPTLSLSLLLAVVAVKGSYAIGGLVLAGFSIALAVSLPISGRLVDRKRARPILLIWAAGHVLAYTAMVLSLWRGAPSGVLVGCGVALGVTTPPCGPVIRGMWKMVVPAEQLKSAFALDAVLTEALFVTGPPLVSLLLIFAQPTVVVAVVGLAACLGTLLLANTPCVERREPVKAAEHKPFIGPLAIGQVRVLLAIITCDTLAFGCVVVGVPAIAIAAGARPIAGVVLGVGSLGAVISGLIYGSRPRSRFPGRQLAMFHAASAVLLIAISRVASLAGVGALYFGTGLVGGPRDTLHQLVLNDATPDRYRTEAFAWMSTFMWVGYALGTTLAGELASHAGVRGEFIAAAAAAACAATLSLFVRSPETAQHVPEEALQQPETSSPPGN